MSYWSGDEWRWRLKGNGPSTITVIDAAEKRAEPENAWRVPFGFSRALTPPYEAPEPPADAEPLLWEGSD